LNEKVDCPGSDHRSGVCRYHGWNTWQKAKTGLGSAGPADYGPAEVRDITFAVNAAGEIAPAEQVSVRPEINGLLEKLRSISAT
jgi:multidrug efflux pump subunit AcrA (membrane-fusion protein)